MIETIEKLLGCVREKRKVALCSVVATRGSTPGNVTYKMLVDETGKIVHGSIGGGCVEADCASLAAYAIEADAPRLKKFVLTEREAGEYGLACGGILEVLVEPVVNEKARAEMERWTSAALAKFGEGLKQLLLTTAFVKDEHVVWSSKTLVSGAKDATLEIPPLEGRRAEIAELIQRVENQGKTEVARFAHTIEAGTEKMDVTMTIVVEPLASYQVVILGAGHVGASVAKLSAFLGFNTTIIDDREDFITQFAGSDDVRGIVCDFETWANRVDIGLRSFVVVVTRGHKFDKEALESALKTKAEYVGLIGSKIKITKIYKELGLDVNDESLKKRVFAPIGIDIGGANDREIAVSIVSEFIALKNRGFRKMPERDLPHLKALLTLRRNR
ncbi:MAG: XdhC family protein [Planctomycetes bacterium]|nr:XdhC family protein [Planctomycetota bacterium]